MTKYMIGAAATLYEALDHMNRNKVKFLLAVDAEERLTGTLTDGDIRRAVLRGAGLSTSIDAAIHKDFTSVGHQADLKQVLDAFRDPRIEFLPVLDEDGKLCNLVTRRALNVLLLQNQRFQIDFDFDSIDEDRLEGEIFARPWGIYKTTVLNDMFQAKVIYIMPGQALSLQSHRHREEYWIVIHGSGDIQLDGSIHGVTPGQSFFIPKGCKHRMSNTSETEILILNEVQLGDYFGEDDIQRYDDRYGRPCNAEREKGLD